MVKEETGTSSRVAMEKTLWTPMNVETKDEVYIAGGGGTPLVAWLGANDYNEDPQMTCQITGNEGPTDSGSGEGCPSVSIEVTEPGTLAAI